MPLKSIERQLRYSLDSLDLIDKTKFQKNVDFLNNIQIALGHFTKAKYEEMNLYVKKAIEAGKSLLKT